MYRLSDWPVAALTRLFGESEVQARWPRLERIHQVAEQAWDRNVERLQGRPIRKLLIGEAPPWTGPDAEVAYFYENLAGAWCGRIASALGVPPRGAVEGRLQHMADQGFLLVDSLPFAMPYTAAIRGRSPKRERYDELVRQCAGYLSSRLNDPRLTWDPRPGVAIAFRLHGESLARVTPGGIRLDNGIQFTLNGDRIAADGSGYTNPRLLRDLWRQPDAGDA